MRERERHAAGFDLREIERGVDQREQVLAVPRHRLGELALRVAELAGAAVQQQIRESDDRVERGAQLVRHVGEELVLELGGALQLDVLGAERELVAAALLQHRCAVESDDHLVAQDLEQPEVVVAEGLPVAPVVDAHGADGHAGGPKRDHRRGLERHRACCGG